MSEPRLYLFGSPHFENKGRPIEIGRRKAIAIISYLAVTGQTHRRDAMATMLWPDYDQSQARAALRRDLAALKKALPGDCLETSRETIGLKQNADLWLDVAQFRTLLETCQTHDHSVDEVCSDCLDPLTEAVNLYRDDFLAGFTLRDSPEFDEWQFFQAEGLRQELASALERLVRGHNIRSENEQAIPYARRWLALDSMHEPAHRELMKLYALTGQQAAALRQYQECVRVLGEELGASPEVETTELFEAIKAKRLQLPTTSKEQKNKAVRAEKPSILPSTQTFRPPIPQHNLPLQPTPFVGRATELADIRGYLENPTCRLLTLAGPGGIGKTRLTVEVAESVIETPLGESNFAHGIYFVSLASIGSPDHLVPTIADALNFSFYNDVDQKVQLLEFLREKEMLLVLDSFDHLLEGADLVSDILSTAPAVKILITSREALNLQEEWFFPVEGLSIPDDEVIGREEPDSLAAYGAVQLFMQSARRARSDFSLEEAQDCVIRICRLVEGMPLGIELAAAWLKVFPCDKIAREIDQNLDFLTTSRRNMPARHRSMRAVFEYSWQLLTEREREVLGRLSVFCGGFRQTAAEQIARATLMELAALVEKSLLRFTPAGRYQMHELLRQFSAEKLEADPQDKEATQHRHCEYFIRFLQQRQEPITGQRQKSILDEIRAEIENVRTAWNWAVTQGQVEALNQGLETLYQFYWIRSRFQEGEEAFRQAVKRLQTPALLLSAEMVLAKILVRQGAFCVALGLYGLARELLQKSLSMARRLDAPSETAFSLNLLGNLVEVQESSTEAKKLYQESLAISKEIGHQAGMAASLYGLGWIAVVSGEYVEAKQYYRESLDLYRAIEHPAGIAHALDSLGVNAFFLGEFSPSERYYRESLTIFQEIGDLLGIAKALGGLGLVAWGVGGNRLTEAKQLFEESLAVTREIGHRLEVARRLTCMGKIANRMEECDLARQYLQEALVISEQIGFSFGIPGSLSGLGETAYRRGDFEAARTYLQEALESAVDTQNIPSVLMALVIWAAILLEENGPFAGEERKEQALEILTLVMSHPATWQVYKDMTSRLLAELEVELPPEIFAATQARGKSKRLEEVVVEILGEQ